MLFAAETVVEPTGLFPDYFWVMLLAVVIVFGVVMALFLVGYRVIDWITPGRLCQELLGRDPGSAPPATFQPNVALAIVAGAMIIGMSIILGLTVHGVLTH